MNPVLPIEVDGVPIDYLRPRTGEEHLAEALGAPVGTILDAPRLVYTKLKASRLRNRGDVAGLVNAGLDVEACRAYLVAHAPDLVAAFDELLHAHIVVHDDDRMRGRRGARMAGRGFSWKALTSTLLLVPASLTMPGATPSAAQQNSRESGGPEGTRYPCLS